MKMSIRLCLSFKLKKETKYLYDWATLYKDSLSDSFKDYSENKQNEIMDQIES